ncbi:MAG: thioesterase family protein, partial [Solirubrobacteraceae bacterium]
EALVAPDWIDYNGHMTESRYLEVLAGATDAFLREIGVAGAYLDSGRSYYTVETHIRHLGEVRAGERLRVATRLLGHDAKRLHLFHELLRDGLQEPAATGEHMLLHVDRAAAGSAPADDEVIARLDAIAATQSGLARPEVAGRGIRGARAVAPQAAAPRTTTPAITNPAPSH